MPVDKFEQLADADRLGGVRRRPERLECRLLLPGRVAVSTTTGISRVSPRPPQRASTSSAARSGRSRSSRIRSGRCSPGELEAQLAEHRGHERDARPAAQQLLDQPHVRDPVLDVEQAPRRRRSRALSSSPSSARSVRPPPAGSASEVDPERAAGAGCCSTPIVPPIASTRLRESTSPSPVPWTPVRRRVQPLERREELATARPRRARGRCRRPRSARACGPPLDRDAHLAGRAVVLDRVREQVDHDLLEPLAVGVRRTLGPCERRAGAGPRGASASGRISATASPSSGAERDDSGEIEMPRLDPGEVEHLVDERRRCAPALRIIAPSSAWSASGGGEAEQLAEADDRRERRPQLVAHPRQELVLRLAGRAQSVFACCSSSERRRISASISGRRPRPAPRSARLRLVAAAQADELGHVLDLLDDVGRAGPLSSTACCGCSTSAPRSAAVRPAGCRASARPSCPGARCPHPVERRAQVLDPSAVRVVRVVRERVEHGPADDLLARRIVAPRNASVAATIRSWSSSSRYRPGAASKTAE